MGKALVAWLEVESPSDPENSNGEMAYRFRADTFFSSTSGGGESERSDRGGADGKSLYIYHSKLDVFTLWLRTALSREYLSSCKFDESSPGIDHDDASSESSTMTHSTIKSRMKLARKGSIIMPFRADTAECLFIS
jgi:hypothetical protein